MSRTDDDLGLGDVRRSEPVCSDAVSRVFDLLEGVQVEIKRDPEVKDLRRSFADIRSLRNKVTRILVKFKARLAGLRGDLIRVERIIEQDSAHMVATRDGLLGCKNEDQRRARVKLMLEEWYAARATLRDEVQIYEQVVSTASIVREELRYAYEEASRSLASIELEYKIETSSP